MIRKVVIKIFLVVAVLYVLLALLTPMGALLPLWLLLAFQDAGVRHPITVELNGTLDGRPFTVAETVVCTADGHILGSSEPNLTETPDFLMHITESGERVVFPIQGLCDGMVWPKHEWGGWTYRIKTGKRFLPMTFFLWSGDPPEEVTAYVSEVAYENPDSRISLTPVKIQEGEWAVREGARKLREMLAPKYEAVSVTAITNVRDYVREDAIKALMATECKEHYDDAALSKMMVFHNLQTIRRWGGVERFRNVPNRQARRESHGLAHGVYYKNGEIVKLGGGVVRIQKNVDIEKIKIEGIELGVPRERGDFGFFCGGVLVIVHREEYEFSDGGV